MLGNSPPTTHWAKFHQSRLYKARAVVSKGNQPYLSLLKIPHKFKRRYIESTQDARAKISTKNTGCKSP